MRYKKYMALLLLVLTGFVAGFFAGSYYVKCSFFAHRPDFDKIPQMLIHRLQDELDLDETQSKDLEKIVLEMHERMMAFHETQRPQAEIIKSEFDAKIRALLNPEQKTKFDDIHKKLFPPFPKPPAPSP